MVEGLSLPSEICVTCQELNHTPGLGQMAALEVGVGERGGGLGV